MKMATMCKLLGVGLHVLLKDMTLKAKNFLGVIIRIPAQILRMELLFHLVRVVLG